MYYVTVVFTKELRLGNKLSSCRTFSCLREKPENLKHIYRCFHILNAKTMWFIRKFVASSHGLYMIVQVWCIFVLFRYCKALSKLDKGPMLLGFPLNTGFWIFVLQLVKYLLVT